MTVPWSFDLSAAGLNNKQFYGILYPDNENGVDMSEQLILPAPKRRPGRPKGDPNQNRVVDVRLRISRQLKERLDAVCQKSGHSIAREIETCIVEALEGQATYGGPRLAQLFRQLADTVLEIELRENRGSMLDDYRTFVEVRRTWRRLIDDLEPRQTMGTYETPIEGGRVRLDFTPGSPAARLAELLAKSSATGEAAHSRETLPDLGSLAELFLTRPPLPIDTPPLFGSGLAGVSLPSTVVAETRARASRGRSARKNLDPQKNSI